MGFHDRIDAAGPYAVDRRDGTCRGDYRMFTRDAGIADSPRQQQRLAVG